MLGLIKSRGSCNGLEIVIVTYHGSCVRESAVRGIDGMSAARRLLCSAIGGQFAKLTHSGKYLPSGGILAAGPVDKLRL